MPISVKNGKHAPDTVSFYISMAEPLKRRFGKAKLTDIPKREVLKYLTYMQQALFEDLHSGGYPALVAAVRTFKPEQGMKFSSWFILYFRNEVGRWMGWRRVEAGKTITTDLHNTAISLNEEVNEDGDERQDFIPDDTNDFEAVEQGLYNEQLHAALAECLATLPVTDREAITGAYYDGLTLREMAEREGVSTERIRQRQKHGIQRLRCGESIKALREFYPDADILAAGLRGSGLRAYKRTGTSSTERIALLMAEGKDIM